MSRWVDLDEQVYCGEMGEYTNYNIDMDTVVDATTIEPSGDLISRADAIVALNEGIRNPKSEWTLDNNLFTISNNRTIALAVERINALPSAEWMPFPKPYKGGEAE